MGLFKVYPVSYRSAVFDSYRHVPICIDELLKDIATGFSRVISAKALPSSVAGFIATNQRGKGDNFRRGTAFDRGLLAALT